MGVRLGVPASEQFKECPSDLLDRVGLTGTDRQCLVRYDETSAGLYEWKPPDIGIRLLDMRMDLAGGSVEGISVKFVRYDWFKMRDFLIAEYGLPHSRITSTYAAKSGVGVPGQVLTWRGGNVTMIASEFGGNFDEGAVTIQTNAWVQNQNREKAKP